MGKYKVYVYAISKNEEKFAERWMESVKEADAVIVTDTGSNDSTIEKLRSAGAIVYAEQIMPWRFDTARNVALSHVPGDADICVSNDIDEVFEPGWREKLESAWTPGTTRASYTYIWSHDTDGNPASRFTMEKIHSRYGYRWAHPVHEVLEYDGEEKISWVEGMVLRHYPDSEKTRAQYLPLLELSAKENPEDDRTVFWLGREYMYRGKYESCIETLKKHLVIKTAVWDEERSASMRFIGESYARLGNTKEAKVWLFRAIAECQAAREPYLAMAKLGYEENDWPLSYAMAKNGLSITKHSGSYLVEPEAWGNALYDYGSISAFNMGMFYESKELAAIAVELGGGDERLLNNLRLIEQKISETGVPDVEKI